MSSRPINYAKLSREQVDILEKHYGEGMKSTTCCQLIQNAAEDAVIPVEKVKKWIGNKNQSLKRRQLQEVESLPDNVQPPKIPKPPSGIRGSNAYNLFCSDFFQSDEIKAVSSLAEKNKLASTKWHSLSTQEREAWVEEAAAKKNLSFSQLDERTKEKLIDQHMKLIAKEFGYLESLGCQSSCLVLKGQEAFVMGSSRGQDFLYGDRDILFDFERFFGVEKKVYTHEDVRQLFNKKYSESKGEVGLRVPYLACGFRVEGLPENIVLKKPRHYRSPEIQAIMNQKDDIKFIIEKTPVKKPNLPPTATQEIASNLEAMAASPNRLQSHVPAATTTTVPPKTTPPVVAADNLAVGSDAQTLVGYNCNGITAALGFRYPERKTLHGTNIPDGYECVLVKWVQSSDIKTALVLGDPDENSCLSVGQFFALPTTSLVHVVLKHA